MKIILDKQAKKDLNYFSKNNKKILEKIFLIFDDIVKNPTVGIGKPEKLRYELSGCWSRRINAEHRVVYVIGKNDVRILSCRYHYK